MNIIKIQDDLKSVPDQALVGYVQNPTGHVPTYLALSELNRRKEMRDKYQQGQPEKKTVAESIVEESQPQPPQMPQGGVAQLPQAQPMMQAMQPPPEMPMQQMAQGGLAELDTGNMFDEANYAGGGIVAFADGGDTETHLNVNTGKQQSADGSSQSNIGGLNSSQSAELLAMARINPMIAMLVRNQMGGQNGGNPLTRDILGFADGGEVQHYAEGGTSKIGDFFRGLNNPAARDIDTQLGALQAEKNKIKMDIFSSYTQEEKAMQQQRLSEIDAQIADLSAQRKGGAPNTPSTIPSDKVLGSQASADKLIGAQYDPSQALNIKSPALANSKLPLAADGTDPYALEKVKGIGDYAKELQDYIGVDPMKAQLQERLSKMDTAAAKQADQAPWMALAQAGFGMASGKSPFAMQNIAEGAGMGLKEYAASKDKLASLEEKRFGLMADLAKADRAEKIAVAKFGADSKQAIEERNAKAKLQQAHDKVLMKMNTEDNNAKITAAGAKGALEAKEILKYKTEFRASHPDYLAWEAKMKKDKGDSVVNTNEFKIAADKLLNQLVARDATLTSSTIDTSQWSLAQPQR